MTVCSQLAQESCQDIQYSAKQVSLIMGQMSTIKYDRPGNYTVIVTTWFTIQRGLEESVQLEQLVNP